MILDPLMALFGLFISKPAHPVPSQPTPIERDEPSFGIKEYALNALRARQESDQTNRQRLFTPAPPPPMAFGGKPPERFANDEVLADLTSFGVGNGGVEFGFGSGLVWLGYPYLAELAQRPEYRLIVELFAKEMTRKWIKLKSTGQNDKSSKIEELTEDIRRFGVRNWFREGKRDDGYFGRGQLYLKFKGVENNPELLSAPLIINPRTIPKGSFIGLQKIEPYWTYPLTYNANNPLRDDFFKPQTWTVFSSTIHDTRMLNFVANEVPDLLKPSYSFGGISTTQLMKPYVDAFLQTKNSVNALISAFSTMVLQTNMSEFLNGGASRAVEARAEAYNMLRDNFGLLITDKETEDFKNVSAPLAGLDELQAQSEEHMLLPMRTPLMKAFGLAPSGLNASTDGEIRSFYDTIASDQEDEFRSKLTRVLHILQLNRYGDIDEDIDFDFEPLWQLDEAGGAAVQKTKADIDLQYAEGGVISPEEIRQRLMADPASLYHGLDLEEGAPGTTEIDGEGNIRPIDDPDTNRIDKGGESGETSGANSGV